VGRRQSGSTPGQRFTRLAYAFGPLEHDPVITIPVNEIPDNDREALAFIKGVKAISAN